MELPNNPKIHRILKDHHGEPLQVGNKALLRRGGQLRRITVLEVSCSHVRYQEADSGKCWISPIDQMNKYLTRTAAWLRARRAAMGAGSNELELKKLIITDPHNNRKTVGQVTYGSYCAALDQYLLEGHTAGFWDKFKAPSPLLKFLREFGELTKGVWEEARLGLGEVVAAFKQKDVFAFLKAIGFNLKLVLSALQQAGKALTGGLLKVFKEISKSGAVQKLRAGTLKVDTFLEQYPLLKKLGGLVVAGLLLYIWLNMSFVGDLDFDLDLGVIIAALHGHFSLAELFASPSGLLMLTLLGTGMMGLSFPWLGHSVLNIILAIAYTGFKKLRDSGSASKLKGFLEFKRI